MQNRKTRILWISFDFPPRLSSGVFRTIKLYKYLDKRNLEVDFITHGRARRFQRAVNDESLLADLTPLPRVVRVPTPILHDLVPARAPTDTQAIAGAPREAAPANSSRGASRKRLRSRLYRRFAMLLYFPDHLFVWGWLAAWTSLWLHARNRYDVVYTTSYPESAHLPGIVLSLLGVNWIVDYRYGGPLWIKKLVGYRKSPVRDRIDQRFQRFVLRRADRVVAQSEPLRRDFCEAFSLDPSHICVIPNGYDERDFDNGDGPSAPFPKQDDEVHLLHVGAMEGVSPPERSLLVDALNLLADDLHRSGRSLVLRAIGNDLFREMKDTMRFTYRYDGVVRHGDVPSYLRSADCLLLSTITTSAGNDTIKGFIPGKLWEYLRADRPILMVGQKEEVWRIIDDIGVGLHLGLNGDSTLSAETLIGRITAARSLHPKVEGFSWESRAHSFQQVLLRVASGAERGIG